jgi:hypothetical protein
MPFVTGVIIDLRTVFIQRRLPTAPILKTMQMYLHPGGMQGFDFLEQIKDPAVIHRIGHIQAHDM